MATNPRQLKPATMIRMLNSTPLGEVLSQPQLHRHRSKAGYRIGDDQHVDLFKYANWLAWTIHAPLPAGPTPYDARKDREARRQAEQSASGRDIGEFPDVVNPPRKKKAETDFRFFCKEYFPTAFYLPWSPDHLTVIAKIKRAVMHGGLFALAMPRGSGKSTLAETACIWAMLTGARDFVCLIGSDAGHAKNMLESIKVEFETNEMLLEDFPEAVFPIHALERIHNRANGQLYHGEHTRIVWTANEIVLPTIPGSKASGAIIRVAGIESRIRGMKHKRPDGEAARPSLVILDDPQTDESSRSEDQTRVRMNTLNGAVLNLAGPDKKIAGVMPCTAIHPDDMADQILDRKKHPVWQGERMRLVYAFPKDEKRWARYAMIRDDSFQRDGDGSEATEFYRENRKAMDAGTKMAWAERYNDDELSAVQHAMNLKLQDERTFFAEYQNEPMPPESHGDDVLTVEQVLAKSNGRKKGAVPLACTKLTMFIDIHDKLLFYCVCGWEENFANGYVVEYDTFPRQSDMFVSMRTATRTLGRSYKGMGTDGAIQAGLEALVTAALGKSYRRGKASMRIDNILVDMGYKPELVAAVKHKVGGTAMMLAKGIGIRASRLPMSTWKRKPGERYGHHWYVPNVARTREFPHIGVDVNFWKTFVHKALATAAGDLGSLSLYGTGKEHALFASHVAKGEAWVDVTAQGRTVREWHAAASRTDNHWFDCLVGCAAAANYAGIKVIGEAPQMRKRKSVKLPAGARRRKRA